MTKPRTKKSPTPTTAKSNGAGPQVDTPKRSGSRIPVPLVTVDADAGYSPEVREAGAALVWLSVDGREEEVTELAMQARNGLAQRVHRAIGSPDGELASVMTDLVLLHTIRNLTAKTVRGFIRRMPSLALEARRDVEAIEKARA